jgi:hypothetical protein
MDSTDSPTSTGSPWRDALAAIPWRSLLAAVPVILVNAVAFAGQLAFLRARLPWPLAGQVLMAVTLESVAVYLAFHAHLAQMANDSALRLRLAAYGFALVIGLMNYSHYAAPGWRPTFAAVALGLMSASSPWLWSVHSRRVSRDVLLAAGLIEPHALRLGGTRWMWHPLRSARVMWLATWEGITEPAEAIAKAAGEPNPEPQVETPATVPVAAPMPPKLPGHRQVRGDYSAGDGTAKKILAGMRTRDRAWLAASNGHANGNGPH